MVTTGSLPVSHCTLVTKEPGHQTTAQGVLPETTPWCPQGLAWDGRVQWCPAVAAPLRIYVVKTVLDCLTKGLLGRVTVTLPGSISMCHWDINKEAGGFL